MNVFTEAKSRIAEIRSFGGSYIDAARKAAAALECDIAELLDDPLGDEGDLLYEDLDFEFSVPVTH